MNLDHRFTSTITYAPFTGRDSSGDPTYGAQATTTARENKETQRIRTAAGLEIESTTTLYTPIAFGLQDRVWLEGADTANVGAALAVLRSGPIKDLAGNVVMHRTFL